LEYVPALFVPAFARVSLANSTSSTGGSGASLTRRKMIKAIDAAEIRIIIIHFNNFPIPYSWSLKKSPGKTRGFKIL
jgi:hypothetical protein